MTAQPMQTLNSRITAILVSAHAQNQFENKKRWRFFPVSVLSMLKRAQDVDLMFVADYPVKCIATWTRSFMFTRLSLFMSATGLHRG